MSTDMRQVALVIVHYRNVADTIECLESVLRLDRLDDVSHRVIVVDNNSNDGSWAELVEWRNQHPSLWTRQFGMDELPASVAQASTHRLASVPWELTLIQSSENRGYAAGANAGLKLALQDPDTTDLWILNNDVVLHPDSLRELLIQSAGHPRAIYGSTLLYQDDTSCMQAAGGAIYLPPLGRSHHVGKRRSTESVRKRVPKFDYIIGAALFFSREVVEEIGLLPEEFYLYFEETEYCALAKSRGIELKWIPEARLVHKEGRSTGAGGGFRHLSDLSFRYIVRNSLLFTERRHPMWLMSVVLYNALECLRHCLHGDVGKVRVFFRALRDYWENRPEWVREVSAIGD